jgi:hypothetical protein
MTMSANAPTLKEIADQKLSGGRAKNPHKPYASGPEPDQIVYRQAMSLKHELIFQMKTGREIRGFVKKSGTFTLLVREEHIELGSLVLIHKSDISVVRLNGMGVPG